jgi:magnesium-transporting ATPase (P-type)
MELAPGQSPDTNFVRNSLAGGVLCSHCEGEIGNPTELSILGASYFAGIDVGAMKKDIPVVGEVPFSSEYKFMATVHNPTADIDGSGIEGKYVVHAKGAPDRVLSLC